MLFKLYIEVAGNVSARSQGELSNLFYFDINVQVMLFI